MASDESTTLDLVERWRQEVVALNRRDMDAVMGFYTADALYDNGPVGLDAHVGHAQIRGFVADWLSSYAEIVFELEEVLDLGAGVTFAVYVQDARIADSDARVKARYGAVGEWVGGLIARQTVYPEADIDEARTAAERLAQQRG
jgi:ketosteroid isomerase-like protein